MNPDKFFRSSPFRLTADPEAAGCWAGRAEIGKKLLRISRSLTTGSDSSLDLMWANLGSGKTHALLHLCYLLERQAGAVSVSTAYVEMPEQLRRFLDLYKRIIAALPMAELLPLVNAAPNEIRSKNLAKASRAFISGGSSEQGLVLEWLAGDKPDLRTLRRAIGIDSRIESDGTACDVLSDIIRAAGKSSKRVILLLDEFQRVAIVKEASRNTILSNLRTVFNRNSSHFSVILAVGSRMEQTAMELLPRELRTLMSIRPTISMPEMTSDEAMNFVLERMAFFRPNGYAGDATAPFGSDALHVALSAIAEHETVKLIPRTIFQVLGSLYEHLLEETVEGAPLSAAETTELLADVRWQSD